MMSEITVKYLDIIWCLFSNGSYYHYYKLSLRCFRSFVHQSNKQLYVIEPRGLTEYDNIVWHDSTCVEKKALRFFLALPSLPFPSSFPFRSLPFPFLSPFSLIIFSSSSALSKYPLLPLLYLFLLSLFPASPPSPSCLVSPPS